MTYSAPCVLDYEILDHRVCYADLEDRVDVPHKFEVRPGKDVFLEMCTIVEAAAEAG